MKQLGYYAKDKNNNLHQFKLDADNTFYILDVYGYYVVAKADDYEILEIGYFTAE